MAEPGNLENAGAHAGTHVVPVRTLAGVLAALLVLTWLTVAATYVDLGSLNLALALGIAAVKGSLVALYFMHLRWDRPMYSVIFISALVFVALFIFLALLDTGQYRPDLIPHYAPALK